MDTPSTERIRNVALVGHSGTGKTTLVEALLHRAGAVVRQGSTDDGSTVCDTEPEEVKRKMSLSVAIAPFDWTASDGETYKVNVIDTPGYADFVGEVDAALAVADLAVVVVSAVDGVEVGTEVAWQACRGRRASPGWCSSTRRTSSAPTSTPCSTSCARRSAAASSRSSCRSARKPSCTASPTC